MLVRITVTEGDIANGVVGCPNACPIALALLRVLGPVARVDVMEEEARVDGPRRARGYMPPVASRFVRAFDESRPVEPFEFVLELENWT